MNTESFKKGNRCPICGQKMEVRNRYSEGWGTKAEKREICINPKCPRGKAPRKD